MSNNTWTKTQYNQAREALDAAHQACFNHPDRGVVGMSHGPFSGVNEALGIIARLEGFHDHIQAKYAEGFRLVSKAEIEAIRRVVEIANRNEYSPEGDMLRRFLLNKEAQKNE